MLNRGERIVASHLIDVKEIVWCDFGGLRAHVHSSIILIGWTRFWAGGLASSKNNDSGLGGCLNLTHGWRSGLHSDMLPADSPLRTYPQKYSIRTLMY